MVCVDSTGAENRILPDFVFNFEDSGRGHPSILAFRIAKAADFLAAVFLSADFLVAAFFAAAVAAAAFRALAFRRRAFAAPTLSVSETAVDNLAIPASLNEIRLPSGAPVNEDSSKILAYPRAPVTPGS
jgi:hypothetical protein